MKRLMIVVLCFAVLPAWAGNDKNIVNAVLKSATVYRSGAELLHTAKASLVQGNNELVLDNISNKVDLNSLQIGSSGTLTILSVEFTTNFLVNDKKSSTVKKLEDSLQQLQGELSRIQVVLKTDKELLDLLKANKDIRGQQNGVTVSELTKMMDYYKAKTLELQNEISLYAEKENRQLELYNKIEQQISEEEKKNARTYGRLQLQVYCPVAGQYDLNVSYVTPNASWAPSYDLRVENIAKPVALSYKAKLVQTTGIDWRQVKLALSTSTPSQHSNAPDIRTWFLSYVNPYSGNNNIMIRGMAAGVQVQPDAHALEEVVVVGYGSAKKVARTQQEDEYQEPIYVVNGSVVSKVNFNKIDQRAIKNLQVIKDAQATAIYGSRASAGAIVATLKEGMDDYVSVKDNELNVVFDIDLPYDVPSNGKEQNVSLKEYKVPAAYRYYSVPNLSKDAYLLGGIIDWAPLNLLPGEANIIFEGTYIGKTMINPGSVLDTLNLTLGRDKRVVVQREKLTDFSSVKFLGASKKQTFTYEVSVRNNKKEKIQMELKDQFPISSNKDIEVELLQQDGASVNNETGILTWKLDLAPGEVKKVRISYSVKYPKEKTINLQ
ncbi:MAG: DUF4139 domain-containing protein [Candidatus Pseudobacter hemicellulosilyticus]|uniref:DUF4139 domain-containing protein n=1 Tax=Candidatus Pseudobacter hemicellulosilyticus TaxID=3121375 RepID=A0AAJ6BJP2_9BACT|nr:MAG: DUF4139 domain-containing protein [Pseudobacter sp.]